MSRDAVMSRLRAANPDRVVDMRNEELRNLIVAQMPPWRLHDRAARRARRRTWVLQILPVRALRSAIAAGGVVAVALVVALVVSLPRSAPSVAQAFPVLNDPSVLTPVALQQSLRSYGVGPHADGLSIARGHVVSTPWGNGYVLTNPGGGFVCVVAPGLSSAGWGASCARTAQATLRGTSLEEYAYDSATRTARFLELLPKGATATMQTSAGPTRQLSLSDGLLAVDITAPTKIAITINGHTITDQVSPRNATAAPTSVTSTVSATSTTVAATPGPTTP